MSDVLLDDGTSAMVRPLEGTDRSALEALHDDVSDGSFRLRFFGSSRHLGRNYVEHLFSDDPAWLIGEGLAEFHLDEHLPLDTTTPTHLPVHVTSVVKQAVGLLIGRGLLPDEAVARLAALAAETGTDRYDAALRLMADGQR